MPFSAQKVVLANKLGLLFCLVLAFFRSYGLSLFRNRIVPARVKWMASKNATHRQITANKKTAFSKGLKAVSGAAGGKPTGGASF